MSKRETYEQLIRALKGESTAADLRSFMGFGALKELLLPLDDKTSWTQEDLRMEPMVKAFHESLQETFQKQYDAVWASLRNATLSSFYTPAFITEPIVEAIKKQTTVHSILEPSAGTGNFISPLKKHFPQASITAIEKDQLSACLLRQLHPTIEALHSSYEDFPNRTFDLVISNIPFGNVSVFDNAMFRESVPVKIKSTTRIHNYYFVKSLDNLKHRGPAGIHHHHRGNG